MAIQYYMRAFNTTLSQYVDWIVVDAPDIIGTFSGYPTNQLIDITVNRIVQSKIENFLKPPQGLGGTDGYFLHVNSYDTRNVTAPIPPPLTGQLVGLAVERGITSLAVVNGATNTSPIQISTVASHGLSTGQYVTIVGVQGNIAANGTWSIIVNGTNSFTLTGSTGSGAYAPGTGTVYVPTDFSTLIWDEGAQLWRFVVNTKGDGTTLGASQSVKVNNFLMDGYLAIGPDPADIGAIRMSNNLTIMYESNPPGTDIQAVVVDTLNRIKLGSVTTDIIYTPGIIDVDGYIVHDGTGTNTALTGFIRDQNNTTGGIIVFRNALGTADITALSGNSANNVVVGDITNVNTNVQYNTATFGGSNTGVHRFNVGNTGAVPNTMVEIGSVASPSYNAPFVRFPAFADTIGTNPLLVPSIYQVTAGAGQSGQTLTVQAQNGGTGTSTGGILSLTSGTGAGTGFHGTLDLSTGGQLKQRIFPTTAGTNSNSILYFENLFRVDAAQTNVLFRQDDASVAGTTYTIQSQNSTGAAGGNLILKSGSGATAAQDGYIFVQTGTGALAQIIVSPVNNPPLSYPVTNGKVIITGNLEVQGTTTTVDSTVVDIIGRVIHANWADPTISSPVAVPSQMVGYSVHRGNTGTAPAGIPRDGAAWIWSEGALNSGADGYWRAITEPGDGLGTDNFTVSNALNNVGVMAKTFAPSPDPNPVTGTLPGTGGLRSPNNLPAVVARNVAPTTTIATTSNLVTLPQGTINVVSTTGFSSPSGTLLIFSDAGVQTVTYTGTSGTTFTGAVGGTGLLHTGNYVAQTNNSTTIAAASNGAILPQATINVASTVGFPASGTLRVVSNSANGVTQSVQTITYTGGGGAGTAFTGCSGGVGTLATGNSVSSPPIAGTNDLVLVGTDFGNRALWGSPSNLTGHIFNTPTGTLYDFQVNSVPQIRIQAGDPDADGYAEVFEVEPTVSNPRLYQLVRPDTGANAGFTLMLQAQNGQQQTGATANNNGGNLVLASGAAGTGGSGAPAVPGNVIVQTDGQLKMTVFPTFAPSASDSNTMLIEESIIRIGPTQNVPLIRQDSTTNASGQSFTLQSQNAVTTGGPLILQSGTGATNDGYINLTTGATVKMTIFPTTAISAANNNSILYFENLFRVDTAQTNPLFRQDDVTTNSATGQTYTIQAQNATGTTAIGGALTLKGGSGTAAGGAVNIQSGAGSPNGVINMLIGGTQAIAFNNVDSDASGFSEVMGIASTITAPRIYQIATGGAVGTILALMAQNAATTGGPLQLHSGTGATNDGYINLTTGNTVKMTVFPTTATVAANNNSILLFENKVRFDTAQVTPLIRQDDVVTASATGQSLTIQAQNATGTTSLGGDGYFTSGTGTTQAGNIHLQTGGVDKVIVHPSFTEFRDTAEAYRVTPVSSGATTLQFASTVTSAKLFQADLTTNSGTGATMTIQAQNETGTTSNGGDLNLTTGTGTQFDGYLHLQAGGSTVVTVHTNKISFNKGWRRHVTNVTTTYQVLVTDDYLAVTALAAPYTITLPASPAVGDTYLIKDTTGNAGTNVLTIAGNGNNIDGTASYVINQAYAAATFTFAGGQWSVN